MRYAISGVLLAWTVAGFAHNASALIITHPNDGDVFHPGDVIALAADVGPNETDIRKVTFNGDQGWAQFIYAPGPIYRANLSVPKEFVGTLTLWVTGIVGPTATESVIRSGSIKIRVVLPPDIILVSMRPDPDKVFLRKMPPGSDPEEVRFTETNRIAVMGRFSDGIERSLSSSIRGTTYETSDPKVATVNSEGLVSAVAPGQATITIKNGEKRVQVPVYVRPPKQ